MYVFHWRFMYICGIQLFSIMQGKKELIPKKMYQVHIDSLVPQNNFYRLLDKELDLRFLYKAMHNFNHDFLKLLNRTQVYNVTVQFDLFEIAIARFRLFIFFSNA